MNYDTPCVLAIDPGAKPGLCGWNLCGPTGVEIVSHRPEDLDGYVFEEVVLEDQHAATHVYKNGRRQPVSRKSQMTLVRNVEALFWRFRPHTERIYRIPVADWRRILWPGAARLTKTVVLARLRAEYNTLVEHLPKTHQGDCLEAVGIAVAWSRLTPEQKEPYRVR